MCLTPRASLHRGWPHCECSVDTWPWWSRWTGQVWSLTWDSVWEAWEIYDPLQTGSRERRPPRLSSWAARSVSSHSLLPQRQIHRVSGHPEFISQRICSSYKLTDQRNWSPSHGGDEKVSKDPWPTDFCQQTILHIPVMVPRKPKIGNTLFSQLGFLDGSDGKESACNAGDLGSIPGLGRSPGEGNDYLLQCSCLENPMDRGAWWATVHRVAKSWLRD